MINVLGYIGQKFTERRLDGYSEGIPVLFAWTHFQTEKFLKNMYRKDMVLSFCSIRFSSGVCRATATS
jgi:hypothetical protein